MKDIFIQFTLTLIIAWIAQLFLPWWSLVPIAAIIALFFSYKYAVSSFFVGFLAIGLLWFLVAFFISSDTENQVLVNKMGELFSGLGRMSLIIATATVGGILGGLGALTGSLGRNLVSPKK